jgi:hypothetical protein
LRPSGYIFWSSSAVASALVLIQTGAEAAYLNDVRKTVVTGLCANGRVRMFSYDIDIGPMGDAMDLDNGVGRFHYTSIE